MMLGKHPERGWRCGWPGIPVGDYELSYEDMSPLPQAYDRALLGGRPDEVPELMAERNPINSADHVQAPVLFLIGEHDRAARSGRPWRTWTGSPRGDIRTGSISSRRATGPTTSMRRSASSGSILDFLVRHVPGVTRPED